MQTENDITIAQFPESVESFQENWTQKHPGKLPGYCHNIYRCLVEDMDGNIVDEKFAVNCMTDYGFNNLYLHYSDGSNNYLWAGEGTGDIDPSSSSMISVLPGRSATNTFNGVEYEGQRFYPEIGMTVSRFHIHTAYFNYTHWDEDKTITEIGIGSSSTNLKFHAKIYDENGNETTITKKVNQRLTIYVYAKMLTPIAELCNNAWNKGCFLLLREYSLFKRSSDTDMLYEVFVNWDSYYPKSKDWYTGSIRLTGNDVGSITDNVYKRTFLPIGNLLIEDQHDYVSEISLSSDAHSRYNGSYYRHNAYLVAMFKPKLDTPMAIESNWFQTNSYQSSNFSSVFGRYTSYYDKDRTGMLPVTDINFTSLKMYSCQDHDFTIDVPYSQPTKSPKYDIGYLRYSIWVDNYISFLNKIAWFRVFVNTAPDVPILSLDVSGVSFYATDTYWDSTTWELIPNLSNIPENLRSKRYYCMLSKKLPQAINNSNYGDSYYTIPVSREQEIHSLVPKTPARYCTYGINQSNSSVVSSKYNSGNNCGKCISNDDYGYIMQLDTLIYPDSNNPNPVLGPEAKSTNDIYPYSYEIASYNNIAPSRYLLWNTTRGGRFITFEKDSNNNSAGCRVYTVSSDPSVAPTYQDFGFDEAFSNTSYTPHWSHSDKGYVVVSYLSGNKNINKTYVIAYDVEGEIPSMFSVEGYHHCHAIDLTDYFCGVKGDVTDHLSLDIYDMKNQEVVDTIDIPEGYEFAGMAGWKNFIYIRVVLNGVFSTYVYYINEKLLTSTPINIPSMAIDQDSYRDHIQRSVESNGNVESCMVMCTYYGNQYNVLFKESDPLNPIRLIDPSLSDNEYQYTAQGNCLYQSAQLRYVNNNKQLLLVLSSWRVVVLDIGWVLDNGSLPVCRIYGYNYRDSRYEYNGAIGVLYKSSVGLMFMWTWNGSYNGNYYCFKRQFWLHPYENYMNLQLKATTRTINAYHNPVRVGGIKGFEFEITNRNVVPSQEETENKTE